jgi:hypothetical protein
VGIVGCSVTGMSLRRVTRVGCLGGWVMGALAGLLAPVSAPELGEGRQPDGRDCGLAPKVFGADARSVDMLEQASLEIWRRRPPTPRRRWPDARSAMRASHGSWPHGQPRSVGKSRRGWIGAGWLRLRSGSECDHLLAPSPAARSVCAPRSRSTICNGRSRGQNPAKASPRR